VPTLREGVKSILSSPASHSPDAVPIPGKRKLFSARGSIFALVLILAIFFVVLSTLFFSTLPQLLQSAPLKSRAVQIDDDTSVVLSGKTAAAPLITTGQSMVLEQHQGLSLLATTDGHITALSTPGYAYNSSVPPVLLSSGLLLYSGDGGIWQTDIFHAAPKRIASFPVDQVLTSLVVSADGLGIAWSTAPSEGPGPVRIYAGTLDHVVQVYQQSTAQCPCFRIFAFFDSSAGHTRPALLLSDDRGDHNSVYYGVWLLNLDSLPSAQPQLLLSGTPSQGPLALSPMSNTLLYARVKGFVPAPTDNSVPDELAAQSYANSLSLISLDPSSPQRSSEQELIASQRLRSNSAEYHWVTTPTFSPDAHTLIYVLFSSDSGEPYVRHNSLYLSTFADASKAQASKPELLASCSADFIELGPWLNNRLLSFYADGGIYLLDTQTNGLVKVSAVSGDYTRIIGVVK
jgi:hypothetical protein